MQHFRGACATSTLLCLLTLSPFLTAQTDAELDRLVFDPVPLDASTGQEINYSSMPLQLLPESGLNARQKTPSEPLEAGALELTRNIARYREAVDKAVSADGPFSPELYESLLDLGSQHQAAGNHEEAIEIFERAEYISRINHGLYDPEQFASIEELIESYLALGDIPNATQKQRYLVYLSEQYYGRSDMQTLPSLVRLADSNMANFNQVMSMPVMPTVSLTTSSGPFGSSRGPTPRAMAFGSLFMAQRNYYRAISTLLNNEMYFDPQLIELEYRFLETLMLQSFRSSIIDDPDYYISERNRRTGSLIKHSYNRRYAPGYAEGKNTFERILIYIRSNPESKVRHLVTALMEYGDWNILFGRSAAAMTKYEEARQVILDLDLDESSLEELFRPAMPVHLPLVTAKPNTREKFGIAKDAKLEHEGYIDLEFTISRYGRAKKFDILATSGNATRRIERRLLRYLRNSPFRPRMQADGSVESDRVTLRYYFSFAEQLI